MRSQTARNKKAGLPAHLLTLLVAAVVVLAGCAPGGPVSSPAPQAGERLAGPPKILRLDNRQEPFGFSLRVGNNDHQREINYSFHAGLTAYNANSEVVGRLAAKVPSIADGDWKVNPDGTMDVTWKLRPNAKWHDGTPFTAADAAFGYQLYLDPELPVNRTGGIDKVQGTTVVDPQTLVVHWRSLYFDANLSNLNDVSPVPVHLMGDLSRRGDKSAFSNSLYWLNEFIGLGPYRLIQWESGSFMEGLAFDDYFLGRPKIDRIILRFNNDPNVSLASFLAGDLDMLTHGATATDRETIRGMRDVTVLQWPDSTSGAIWQWRDPAAPWVGDESNAIALGVRRAMMHLLDRQLMADTFEPGGAGVAHLFVGPNEPAYKKVEALGLPKYDYDQARAAQLLATAGWTKGSDGKLRNSAGETFKFEILEGAENALVYGDMLRQGGIDAYHTSIPNSAVDRMERRAKSQGVRVGGGAIAGDFMRQFTTKEVRSEANNWSGLNQGGYVNPAVDRQYDQFLVEFDPTKRNEIESGFHKLVADQVLRITWYYTGTAAAFKSSLSGPIALTSVVDVMTWNIHEWDLK